MKAADTPIAEDLRERYEALSKCAIPHDTLVREELRYIERLSLAEERVRVLTDIVKARFGKCGRSGCRAVNGIVNHNYCPECKAIDAAVSTPAPEQPAQPSAENATPLTVQAQDGAVLVEDHDRNLSVLALLEPLHITCPWDGQRWCFHTQAQLDMFQKHLDWHANGGSK